MNHSDELDALKNELQHLQNKIASLDVAQKAFKVASA